MCGLTMELRHIVNTEYLKAVRYWYSNWQVSHETKSIALIDDICGGNLT